MEFDFVVENELDFDMLKNENLKINSIAKYKLLNKI